MTVYLQKRGGNERYIYSTVMAKRTDMEIVEIPDEVPAAPVVAAVTSASKPAPAEPVIEVLDEDDDPSVDLAVDSMLDDIFGDKE